MKKRIIFELDGWKFFSEKDDGCPRVLYWIKSPIGAIYRAPYYAFRVGHGQFYNFVKAWFKMME